MAGTLLRRRAAGMLLSLGLFFALFAYNGLIVRGIVVDGDVAERAASTALRNDHMQQILADSTADAIESQYLGDAIRALEAQGYDPSGDVAAVANAVVADPLFADAFGSAVRDLHDYVLVERTKTPTIDATGVLAAARAAAIAQNPAYEPLLPAASTLQVELPTDTLPNLTSASSALIDRAKLAGLVAVALVFAAFAIHSHRPHVVRRIGTWALSIAVVQGVVALALPLAAGWMPEDVEPVAEALAITLRPRLLVPAVMMAAAGIALIVGAWRWKRSLNSTHERYGASAFLASDDPNPYAAVAARYGQIETATLRSPMGAPPVPLVSPAGDAMSTTSRGA